MEPRRASAAGSSAPGPPTSQPPAGAASNAPSPSQFTSATVTVRLRQRLARADHHPPGLGVEPHHEERLAAADPEAAALADGVANDPLVPPEHPAVEVHDLARLGRAGPQLLDHRGIGAVRHEADVLAVGLVGHRSP